MSYNQKSSEKVKICQNSTWNSWTLIKEIAPVCSASILCSPTTSRPSQKGKLGMGLMLEQVPKAATPNSSLNVNHLMVVMLSPKLWTLYLPNTIRNLYMLWENNNHFLTKIKAKISLFAHVWFNIFNLMKNWKEEFLKWQEYWKKVDISIWCIRQGHMTPCWLISIPTTIKKEASEFSPLRKSTPCSINMDLKLSKKKKQWIVTGCPMSMSLLWKNDLARLLSF